MRELYASSGVRAVVLAATKSGYSDAAAESGVHEGESHATQNR